MDNIHHSSQVTVKWRSHNKNYDTLHYYHFQLSFMNQKMEIYHLKLIKAINI